MCDPVTATLVAVSVITTGAQMVGQAKMAKAQNKAIKNQLAVTNEEARQEATGELFEQMRASRREQGRIRAAAGEAGLSLSSGSIEALLSDSQMQGEFKNDVTLANQESRTRANVAEATSMYSQVEAPSALGIGLNMAAAGASAWAGSPNAAKISKKG